jgi:hypothetical protein
VQIRACTYSDLGDGHIVSETGRQQIPGTPMKRGPRRGLFFSELVLVQERRVPLVPFTTTLTVSEPKNGELAGARAARRRRVSACQRA